MLKLVCFLFSVTLNMAVCTPTDLDTRLSQMSRFRVGGSCSVPWGEGLYRGEIQSVEGEKLRVRVLDHGSTLGEWPLITIDKSAIFPPNFVKAESNQELIESLKAVHILSSPSIEKTLIAIDRKWFCEETPYYDAAIDIGYDSCISSPHMHVWALELSRDHFKTARKILDVGSGSGYLVAAFADLAPNAHIYGLEYVEELNEKASRSILTYVPELAERITLLTQDGEAGYLPGSPYDIIHVGFMCHGIPKALLDQLRPGGILILPTAALKSPSSYDPRLERGVFTVVKKKPNGSIEQFPIMNCSYVPSKSKQ